MSDIKYNATPKAKKIKKKLEELGHTNVKVWWETICGGCEMCGYEGGWFFESEENSIEPIGYSFEEAMEHLESDWFDVRADEQNE